MPAKMGLQLSEELAAPSPSPSHPLTILVQPPCISDAPNTAICKSLTKSASFCVIPDFGLPSASLFQKMGAEMIATFILVLTGCGSAMVDTRYKDSISHFGVSAAFGLVVMIMIYATGHISGAHMNPAVTIAYATAKHFPWKQVPAYITAQITGAIGAAYMLRLVVGPVAHIGATFPGQHSTHMQAFAAEILITFILMFVVAAVATDTRAVGEMAGLAVGATVALNAIFAGPISGASMNPARSLGPAVAANKYESLWIYILAPTIGALAGALSYSMIKLPEEETKRSATFKHRLEMCN